MGFQSFAAIGRQAAQDTHWQYVYKPTTPNPGTVGFCVDLNQSSGIPKYNPFPGSALTATPLEGLGNLGIFPGSFISGRSKHLLRWQISQQVVANGPPDYVHLLDYLLFYPLIDTDTLEIQSMDNTLTLPRYETGEGVQIALIIQSPLSTSSPITITYTNSDGVSGRSSTFNLILGTTIGVCATGSGPLGGASEATPFFPLALGDKGVRSIESAQMSGGAGGFIVAVLVKPLADIAIMESNVTTEKQFGMFGQNPPEIMPGACLNFLVQRGGSVAGNYVSELLFVNS
jgi:hypothetical protein